MIIAVDFDGTIVENAFPAIGNAIPEAVETLKFMVNRGHRIILHTCRTNRLTSGRRPLDEAAQWCKAHGIELYAVNDNPVSRAQYGAQSKVYADMYIDDHGFGIPMVNGHVDWMTIKAYFKRLKR